MVVVALCLAEKGTGALQKIDAIRKEDYYLLFQNLKTSAIKLKLGHKLGLFHKENDQNHTSKVVTK